VNGVLQAVTHVKIAGNIGRRNSNAVRRARKIYVGIKNSQAFPKLIYSFLYIFRIVSLRKHLVVPSF
jgi:hypothetical protein